MNLLLINNQGLTYQWDGPVDDPTSPTPIALGTELENIYRVTITDAACGLTREDEVVVTCAWANGVEETNELDLTLFPNPTNGMVVLRGENLVGLQRIKVYNWYGQKLYEQAMSFDGGQAVLDLHDLASGAYLLEVDDGAQRRVGKLVLQP